ncbi:MAG: replication associated protein [Wigfec virus K19_654]|nr:MAG: replication associated protein [Wigfec virus K19_654]
MPFEINSSRLFLTYPQCSLTKEHVYNYLSERYSPEEIIVAHELHKNGDHHIHAYLKLSSALRTRDCKFADIENFHGNYQGCRSAKNVIKYCTKEEDFLSNIDVSAILKKSSSRKEHFGSVLLGKRTLLELVEEEPQYLMGYCRLKNDYLTFIQDKTPRNSCLPDWLPNPWGKVLSTRIKGKRRHYWIYSTKPNLGKTFLFGEPLVREYNGHLRVGSEPYWDIRGDEQFVVLDEYNSAIFRYDQLNSMCDGNFAYRIFMGGVKRLHYPILIVLSNLSISTIYPNMHSLLYARFNEIHLDP